MELFGTQMRPKHVWNRQMQVVGVLLDNDFISVDLLVISLSVLTKWQSREKGRKEVLKTKEI